MTKTELAAKVAENTGMTKKDSAAAVNAVFEEITKALVNGEKVQLVGFGSFDVKVRPAHTGINPATKQKIEIAASRSPKFTAGAALKEAVK
ncbi:MAG: HU family DNA-binding protein [Eubacterium sp.]|jgi:DNA-binding protein HU-beta|nr:HU family DNA-binding protein [Eubacterium sp.]MBQ3412608.1 HU family DNA-binding protein [Oscillospiraceae bacterium]